MKRSWRIVLCKESPCNWISVDRLFLSLVATMKFYRVGFNDTSSAGKTARKSQKYLNLLAFNFKLNHSICELHSVP